MKAICVFVLLWAIVGYAPSASATDFRFDAVSLVVPSAFEGPVRAALAPGAETVAFSVPRGPGVPTNVLQLTRYDFGDSNLSTSEADRLATASQQLLKMLSAIERQRSAYTQTAPEPVTLGGSVGVRSSWQGELRGVAVHGVLYALVIGRRTLFFHAFGPGDRPDAELAQVISAIEALQVDDSPDATAHRSRSVDGGGMIGRVRDLDCVAGAASVSCGREPIG